MRSHLVTANLNATVGVFFDSFAKIAVSIAVLTTTINMPVGMVLQRVIPGVCCGIFVLNLFYYFQAYRMNRGGACVTALPSGLQASCVFVWLFALMLPIATKTHDPVLAYQVALLANLINAIIFTISGVILLKLQRFIPTSALFSGLAGSAFTWLAVNNLPVLFEHPLSGLLPFLIILVIMIARYNSRLPLIMLGVIIGTIIALLTKEFSWNFQQLNQNWGVHLPHLLMISFTPEIINYCLEYLPLIIAFAIIDAISAVQILEESRLSKDYFNPYTSVIASGVISGASTFIGNPFAMALFFGHYSWKQQGADHRYSLYNGITYLLLALTGGAAFLVALIPNWVTLPVLILIGLNSTAISFTALKKEEYILLIIGIIPILTELIYNKLELLALQNHIANFMQLPEIAGMFILAKGSILFSLVLTTALYYIMHRLWRHAACSFMIILLCSTLGLIHSATPHLQLWYPMNYIYTIGIVGCLIMSLAGKNNAAKI